jgi:hypothetical protein
MTTHIIKLCVGADTVEDLANWHAWQTRERRAQGQDPRPVCDTRMTPKRRAAVLDGGSLYWVIKGVVCVRQAIEDIVTLDDGNGRSRCELVLNDALVRTAPLRRKAFQGWRYLDPKDAPADLSITVGGDDLPEDVRKQLIEMGAW